MSALRKQVSSEGQNAAGAHITLADAHPSDIAGQEEHDAHAPSACDVTQQSGGGQTISDARRKCAVPAPALSAIKEAYRQFKDLQQAETRLPSETASGIPDDLYAAYREQIATGAKSRLMLIKGQGWFDPEYGAALAGAFAGDIAAARLAAVRATGRGRISARPSFC